MRKNKRSLPQKPGSRISTAVRAASFLLTGTGCFVRRIFFLLFLSTLLTGCGFKLQGEKHLAPPLHRMYLQTPDPYGQLARSLQQYLKLSDVQLVSSPKQATTILAVLRDEQSQELLSVSGTLQTRQYTLRVTAVFEITDPKGSTIVGPQSLTESRTITIQSNQILGSSNEANLFYQQMRRTLAYAILNRIASKDISKTIDNAFISKPDNNTP